MAWLKVCSIKSKISLSEIENNFLNAGTMRFSGAFLQ